MLAWMKWLRSTAKPPDRPRPPERAQPKRLSVPAEYLPLHKYLDARYAIAVVLTFAEIEDLIGFALPDLARRQKGWWSYEDADSAPSAQSRSWAQASRTATPNLLAQTVLFERA
jgi:hypothetical protein